jgi:glutaconate CoA-transferase subunit A
MPDNSRLAQDKRISLEEGIDLLPEKGCNLAFGGVTLYRRPMAFSLALLQRGMTTGTPCELDLLCFTAGLESDILVGAGLVRSIRTCYFGLEVFGLAPHFTSAAANGSIEIIEESEASIALGLRAAMAGVGFMPSPAWQGTDMLNLRPEVKSIVDPYTGERLTAFPALPVKFAVLHALRSDPFGNAQIGDNQGVDRELALLGETVIITTEKIVDQLPKADIVGTFVDAVIEAPNGAWPSSCHPNYPIDGMAILEYTEQAGTDTYHQMLQSWLKRL